MPIFDSEQCIYQWLLKHVILSKMLPKYERKSDRVKSVSFHPTRPLLLSALHSGIIELIDYRMKQRLSTYEDHEGAVRAI